MFKKDTFNNKVLVTINNNNARQRTADIKVSRMQFPRENTVPAVIDINQIKKERLTPGEMFNKNFTPAELKMIKEDADYFIRDPNYREQLKIFDKMTLVERIEKEERKNSQTAKKEHILSFDEGYSVEEDEPMETRIQREQRLLFKQAEKRKEAKKEVKSVRKEITEIIDNMERRILEAKKPVFKKKRILTMQDTINELKKIYKVEQEKKKCLENVKKRNEQYKEKVKACFKKKLDFKKKRGRQGKTGGR